MRHLFQMNIQDDAGSSSKFHLRVDRDGTIGVYHSDETLPRSEMQVTSGVLVQTTFQVVDGDCDEWITTETEANGRVTSDRFYNRRLPRQGVITCPICGRAKGHAYHCTWTGGNI